MFHWTHGSLSSKDYQRMGDRGALVGFTTVDHIVSVLLKTKINKFLLTQFTAEAKLEDLEKLALLIQDGKIKVHIEKTHPYTEIPVAIRYIKTVLT
ncbi:zinc-binding dehydrogenase [Xanthocytophaga agilis]|uniref:Zinc-binding dehydrogenase n=1 Tax=Xanthocytophaga agilis TaxID=3048010 RepID=A0AAE3RDE8_9BACT|nr:zinc-binding dehydrogenase [Xanthocytophaga agilis]MDJ1505688.1 zinc-binding dehydrogenase [Xanthocytophaga agilis]